MNTVPGMRPLSLLIELDEMVRNDLIVKECSRIGTVKDLLNLMNRVKREMYGFKAYSFTIAQLLHFSDTRRNRKHYRSFRIPKRSGGFRTIIAPSGMLKSFQTVVRIILQALYDVPPFVNGFVPGKSVKENASPHVRMNYVFNADIKDFFPSISFARVWRTLQYPPFRFSPKTASIIAGICCTDVEFLQNEADRSWERHLDENRYEYAEEEMELDPSESVGTAFEHVPQFDPEHHYAEEDQTPRRNALPQGAPSSPVLSNIICRNLDRKLAGLARRFGLNYSRYADDITFSSQHNVYQADGEFLKEFRRIVAVEGFILNEKKTRLQRAGQRQEVTGLTVNSKVNVPRAFIRDLDNVLYIWRKYGASAAYARLLARNVHVKNGRYLKMDDLISGRLGYIRMIKGSCSPVWQRLVAYHDECVHHVPYGTIRYIHSWRISDFETITGLQLKIKKDRYYGWSCFFGEEFMEEFVLMSKWCRSRLARIMESDDAEALTRFKQMNRIGLCYDSVHAGIDTDSGEDVYDFEYEKGARSVSLHPIQEQFPLVFGQYKGLRFFWMIFRRHSSEKRKESGKINVNDKSEAQLEKVIDQPAINALIKDFGLQTKRATMSRAPVAYEDIRFLFDDAGDPF